MLICKICNKEISNHKSGLAQHVIKTHKVNYWNYQIEYEKIIIPKCVCGKDVQRKGDGCKKSKAQGQIKFKKHCGNIECLRKHQSIKHLEYMKNNPEKTAWRLKNISYPEQKFLNKCYDLGFDKKYYIVREYSVFPYFIDFAFINEKVAVEIDGSQHELIERKEKDKQKDNFLIKSGWRVLRFTAKQINYSIESCFEELITFIKNENIQTLKSGIEEYQRKKYIPVPRSPRVYHSRTKKEIEASILKRKVDRPPYENLKKEIKELGYSATGRKYGVSDNAIRKWIKYYENNIK